MVDHVFVNAIDADGNPLNIAVKNGRFASISPKRIEAENAGVTDLQGYLVLPGFVDSHIHLDKSLIGDRWHPHVPVTNFRERLAVEKQELAAAPSIAERADALLHQTTSFGTIAMRSHVDVDATTQLKNFHAIMEIREKWRDTIDIQLVAFPQAGVITCPGTAELLDAAIAEGAEVIGGIDPTTLDGDADGQLDIIFGIAEKRGVKVDIHLHEPGQICVDELQRIATRTRALGMKGQVTVSHAYGLGDVTPDILNKIAEILAESGVSILTNAPGDRAFPPIWQLHKAGVRVLSGNDNIQDAWWPYGNGDMLQRAMIVGYRSGLYTDEALHLALRMATETGAEVLGKSDYGLKIGNEATFVVLKALSAAAAVATAPYERTIIRKGQLNSNSAGFVF